jgi:hypothetical protein
MHLTTSTPPPIHAQFESKFPKVDKAAVMRNIHKVNHQPSMTLAKLAAISTTAEEIKTP